MPKFLVRASYTQSGIAGVLREGGSSRVKAIQELAASVGGSADAIYWALGEDDFFMIADLPDNTAAAAVAATVGATGTARVTTVPLLSADEVDRIAHTSVEYRPPGG
jgi:uncharacterized protein with GYD domain